MMYSTVGIERDFPHAREHNNRSIKPWKIKNPKTIKIADNSRNHIIQVSSSSLSPLKRPNNPGIAPACQGSDRKLPREESGQPKGTWANFKHLGQSDREIVRSGEDGHSQAKVKPTNARP